MRSRAAPVSSAEDTWRRWRSPPASWIVSRVRSLIPVGLETVGRGDLLQVQRSDDHRERRNVTLEHSGQDLLLLLGDLQAGDGTHGVDGLDVELGHGSVHLRISAHAGRGASTCTASEPGERAPSADAVTWQAARWAGSKTYSGGTWARQTSSASRQRGLNAQPGGRSMG